MVFVRNLRKTQFVIKLKKYQTEKCVVHDTGNKQDFKKKDCPPHKVILTKLP